MKQLYSANAHGGSWGVGETPEEALAQAREVYGDPAAEFDIESISKASYDRTIENDRNGWAGHPVIITDDEWMKVTPEPVSGRSGRSVDVRTMTSDERRTRFQALREALGLTIVELAKALGRPRGTLTAYTHGGTGSRAPSVAVLDEMEDLLLVRTVDQIERAKKIVSKRGFAIMLDDEVDQLAHPWLSDVEPKHLVLSDRKRKEFLRGSARS